MAENFVQLTIATHPVQESVINAVLTDGGIPFETFEESAFNVILGSTSPVNKVEFRVPDACLQEAKDLLCANGVVCEVSERLLRRALEEIVQPLLNARGSKLERLLYFVKINNKETLRALFEATLLCPGGRELLEDLFFAMAEDGLALSTLARTIEAEASPAFGEKFQLEAATTDKNARIALFEVLAKFHASPWRLPALATGLLDPDAEIREAASESLFALQVDDAGYDPEAPPEERKAAVEEILRADRDK